MLFQGQTEKTGKRCFIWGVGGDIETLSSTTKMRERERDSRKYITGKVSSGFTRGAIGIELASGRAVFPAILTALSFFNFLIEAPCFPPSTDLF